jgi:hypothetical protein
MAYAICICCEDVFDAKESRSTKCPECEMFGNLLCDAAKDICASLPHVKHLTPKEAGIELETWDMALARLLQELNLREIRCSSDLMFLMGKLCHPKRGVDAWTAIVIATKLYQKYPSICKAQINPFRFLKMCHPTVTIFMTKVGKTLPELYKEALAVS